MLEPSCIIRRKSFVHPFVTAPLALPVQNLKDTDHTCVLNTHRPRFKDVELAPEGLQLHLHLELEGAGAAPDGEDLSETVVGAAALGAGVARVGA